MRPDELLKTIYLGDRAVKTINLDGFGKRISIQVDEISRIRSASGLWEYYNEENIVDGLLVFTQVLEVRFDPPGLYLTIILMILNVNLRTTGIINFNSLWVQSIPTLIPLK